jgi:putative addiction module component (TIGR02574 family)
MSSQVVTFLMYTCKPNNQGGGSIMLRTGELIEEALSLPVEERALIADSLLRSLNMPDTSIDAQWLEVARRRLQELRSGKVKPIPGDEVFAKVLKRLAK